MSDRPRDGVNTVTVTPTSVLPGGKVTIKVTTTDFFIGVLGTVYAGDAQVGTHAPPAGTQACMGNANAITHSAPLPGAMSLSWEFTVPATASGMLEARVVTLLNGPQKFAIGKATFTVGQSAPVATTTTTVAGATTTTAAGNSTTASAATLVASAATVVAAFVASLL